MKKIISIYGRAASGKTTQADLLETKYGFHQFGMGDRLRDEIESGSELGQKIQPFVDKGVLIPDELMEKVLGNVFVETKESGLMLEGFPRMIGQAKMMEIALKESSSELDAMFYLNVSTDEAISRIQKRAEIGGREDDKNPEVVRTRLKIFDKESIAVLDYYRQAGKLIEIDGGKTIEEIFEIICKEIEK
ncbi:MAG: adenylate kinase family protein [Patescibacteria group bacterium]